MNTARQHMRRNAMPDKQTGGSYPTRPCGDDIENCLRCGPAPSFDTDTSFGSTNDSPYFRFAGVRGCEAGERVR